MTKKQFIVKVAFLVILLTFYSCNNSPTDNGDDDNFFIPIETLRTIDTEPDWSPDGKTIAYRRVDGIWLLELETMEKQFLTEGMLPDWSPDGKKIAYVKNDDIHVIDIESKQITRLTDWRSCYSPSWSPDGMKIAFDAITKSPTVPVDSAGIWIMNSNGSQKTLVIKGRQPDWSPDENRLVYYGPPGTATGTESQIWVASVDGTNQMQLTERNLTNRDPSWSPDGSKIAWGSYGPEDNPLSGIWVMNADGTNQRKLTEWGGYPSWSPDGRQIVYYGINYDSDTGTLWLMNADGTDQHPLTEP
jgi:Tol biopolymer transport system component